MSVRPPTLDELKNIAKDLCMTFSEEEIKSHLEILRPNFEAYNLLDQMSDYIPEVKYPRTPGYTPEGGENGLNAWYRKSTVRGAKAGPLAGHKIVLKDNINLAGVPMMNGASTLEGYIPEFDATVVTRILEAGGEIAGKAHCEYFCLSGGSHTNARNAVKNAHNPQYSSGGSSSGCGALVGSGEIDMAIGCDQGGSIRIPASWNGCVGMKATHGLVPYTGIMPIEATIDYTGPITNNVTNNALLLDVIAGEDNLDPRQYAPQTQDYLAALGGDISGLKIGLVKEGFGRPESEPDVDETVRKAAAKLQELGAVVEEVSIPWHNTGSAIWLAIVMEGLMVQMMHGNGMGFNWGGLYNVGLIDAHASWRQRADDLSDSLKTCMLTGQYMLKKYRGRYYAKAQNLNRRLRQEYNKHLANFDLLLMPTTPMKATLLPGKDAGMEENIQKAFEMTGNTCPFDASGHPALTIPVGMSEGLPVGMMLVGKHYDEATLYKAAFAFEKTTDWTKI